MSTVKALKFEDDGTASLITLEGQLEPMREAIGGGWLEAINVGDWHAYFDEEGKIKGLPGNLKATLLAHAMGWSVRDVLCGPVIFLGTDHMSGNENDVPDDIVNKAVEMGLLVLPG